MRTIQSSSAGHRSTSIRLAVVMVLAVGLPGCVEDSTAPPPTDARANPQVDRDYRLAGGGKTLVDTAGGRVPVDPKRAIGYVDAATPNGDFIDLTGWAAPTDLSRPAEVIVAIVERKSVAAVAPSVERPDLVEGYDRPGLRRSGFVMSVPVSSLDCSAPQQGLKTFTVANGAAAQLELLEDVPERIAEAC